MVHDDLDLEPGRLRIKLAGGHGGHNGIKSIIEALGTPQFVRLKIGIGRPAPGQDSADYVLEPVTKDEMAVFEPLSGAGSRCTGMFDSPRTGSSDESI